MCTQKSCWECSYFMGKDSFFGSCLYFETIGKERKEIPVNIVDVGCKLYVNKNEKEEHPLLKYALELFDGEIIK